MPLTDGEIEEIAHRAAEEIMARAREGEFTTMLLQSVPYAYGSPGIVVDEAVAKASPCRCLEYSPVPASTGEYRPGRRLCFSRGIIGALSEEQERAYCPEVVPLESPGLRRRLGTWMEAVETCRKEIAGVPRGERLEPWLTCMGRELRARGVEA